MSSTSAFSDFNDWLNADTDQDTDQPTIEPLAPGMPMKVKFKNNFGQSRYWWIEDLKIDPNMPKEVFKGYLDDEETTEVTLLGTAQGSFGEARYKRSDGVWTLQSNIRNGDRVDMH